MRAHLVNMLEHNITPYDGCDKIVNTNIHHTNNNNISSTDANNNNNTTNTINNNIACTSTNNITNTNHIISDNSNNTTTELHCLTKSTTEASSRKYTRNSFKPAEHFNISTTLSTDEKYSNLISCVSNSRKKVKLKHRLNPKVILQKWKIAYECCGIQQRRDYKKLAGI